MLFIYASLAMLLGNSDACCKVCLGKRENPGAAHPLGFAGVPCGDSCIPEGKTCDQTHGCACSAKSRCCKFCDIIKKEIKKEIKLDANKQHKHKACGDDCIASDAVCNKPHGCACDEDVGHEENRIEL